MRSFNEFLTEDITHLKALLGSDFPLVMKKYTSLGGSSTIKNVTELADATIRNYFSQQKFGKRFVIVQESNSGDGRLIYDCRIDHNAPWFIADREINGNKIRSVSIHEKHDIYRRLLGNQYQTFVIGLDEVRDNIRTERRKAMMPIDNLLTREGQSRINGDNVHLFLDLKVTEALRHVEQVLSTSLRGYSVGRSRDELRRQLDTIRRYVDNVSSKLDKLGYDMEIIKSGWRNKDLDMAGVKKYLEQVEEIKKLTLKDSAW